MTRKRRGIRGANILRPVLASELADLLTSHLNSFTKHDLVSVCIGPLDAVK